MFRPLNLALTYFHKDIFTNSNTNALSDSLIEGLKAEKLLISSDEDVVDHVRLIKHARKGAYRFICILPTTECSLHCAYCHQHVPQKKARTMTRDEITHGLGKCSELCSDKSKPVDILLYGGEPLLAFEITEEILHLTRPGYGLFDQQVRISFTTSGSGLSDEQADVLAKNNVFVILSVDGSPDLNDPVRKAPHGQSAFAMAERGFEMLKSRGCRVGLSVTIGSHNIDNLKAEVEYLLDRFTPNDIGLNAFLHRCTDAINPFQVKSEEAFEQFMEAFGVTREHGVYAEQPFRRLKPFVFRKPLVKDCSSPGERLVLVPGGMMGFCDSCYPDNRYFYSFEEFPERDHGDYHLWSGLSSTEMPECCQCPVMTICGGACRFDAFKASGRLDGTDPERCRFERAFLNWMIWELFDLKHIENDTFYFPSNQDRMKLFGNVVLQDEDQPFTAGSYSE